MNTSFPKCCYCKKVPGLIYQLISIRAFSGLQRNDQTLLWRSHLRQCYNPQRHKSSSEHGWSSLQSRPLGRSLPRPICSRKVLLPSFGHHFHVTIVLLWQHKIWIENCLFLGTNWWIKFHPTNLKLLCGMSSCDNDIRFTPECWRPFSQTPGNALNKTLITLYVYLSSVTKKIIK